MYLVDTCTFRLVRFNDATVMARLSKVPYEQVYLSSVVVEQALKGALNTITTIKSNNPNKLSIGRAYEDLSDIMDEINQFQICLYTDADEMELKTIDPGKRRLGGDDCRIAVQAKRLGWTVITSDMRHFSAIGAVCADWSR